MVVNTGATTWVGSKFALTYWSGYRFINQSKSELEFDVTQNDDVTLESVRLTAPSSAGTYRAVWAVVNGFTPYCLMGLTVVVK